MTVAHVPALPALRRPVLAEAVLPKALTRGGVTVVLGAALTALAAQVAVPIPGSPVPVTGQTFAVLVTAAALGPARGLAAQLLYLAAGMLGLPVFANAQHGTGAVLDATGGYLVGFVVAALITGRGARLAADRSPWRTLPLMALATAAIYLFGAGWLVLGSGMTPAHALAVGVAPFLVGDAVKAALAAGLLPGAWKLLGRDETSGSGR